MNVVTDTRSNFVSERCVKANASSAWANFASNFKLLLIYASAVFNRPYLRSTHPVRHPASRNYPSLIRLGKVKWLKRLS